MKQSNIDFVVTWVDGDDPEWLNNMNKYLPPKEDNSASVNRFRDWNLMRYWFRGVEKYAPWVNKIYFVTCGHYPDWLNLDNPKLVHVKHEDYIPKDILPTFNSNTIEMYLNNIKDLSETFVLFNDDTFVISPIEEKDFFSNGLPCEAAILGIISSRDKEDVFSHIILNNISIINKHFVKNEVIKTNKSKFFSVKYGPEVIRNILLLPFAYFSDFRDQHLPASHLKSVFNEVWDAEPEVIYNATKSRFRSTNDVMHWLIKDWYMCKGMFVPRKPKWGMKFELGADDISTITDYMLEHRGKVVCLNDSNDAIDYESTKIILHDVFEKLFPDKSSFEK